MTELIWLLAGSYSIARVAHAAGISAGRNTNPGRRIGGMLTLWCHAGAAVLLIFTLVPWLDT